MINTDQKNPLLRKWQNSIITKHVDSHPLAMAVVLCCVVALMLTCYHFAMLDDYNSAIGKEPVIISNYTPCTDCHKPTVVTFHCEACHLDRVVTIKGYAGYKKAHPSPADMRLLKELEAAR